MSKPKLFTDTDHKLMFIFQPNLLSGRGTKSDEKRYSNSGAKQTAVNKSKTVRQLSSSQKFK